jgi:GTP cyclohydrolase II
MDISTQRVDIETEVRVPLASDKHGEIDATFISFTGLHEPHFAIRLGSAEGVKTPLVRIHSECVTGDTFGSLRCDCGPQLQEAITRIHEEGGYILYLRQEGRGIGLNAKLQAYREQDKGLDTFSANRALGFADDLRDFKLPCSMLDALKIKRVRLLSNNPEKHQALIDHGIEIIESVATGTFSNPNNQKYLEAKHTQKQHQLNLP